MPQNETPAEKFDRLFTFKKEAFRIETLPKYSVGDKDKRFETFLAGKIPNQNELKDAWCESLKQWTENGKDVIRVRVIPESRGAYFNFEVEWGYPPNVESGEDINVIAEDTFIDICGQDTEDIWLLDESKVLQMQYGDDGQFEGVKLTEDGVDTYITYKQQLLEESTDFTDYLKQRRRRKV